MDKFTVIRDSQEKENHGWQFNKTDYCNGTIIDNMKTGDYTLCGYENILTIERKGNIAEFAHNIIEARFDREIERMAHIPHSFIILEFNMSDILAYPWSSRIPRKKLHKIKMRGDFILKRMSEIMIKYPNIKILCCGKNGKEMARSIFKRIYYDKLIST